MVSIHPYESGLACHSSLAQRIMIFCGYLTVSRDSSKVQKKVLESAILRVFDYPGAYFLLCNINDKPSGKLWALSVPRELKETESPLLIMTYLEMSTAD